MEWSSLMLPIQFPGLYRLRIEGLQGKRSDLLAEYLLQVER